MPFLSDEDMPIDPVALELLFHETDSERVRQSITTLVRRRYPVQRKTPYHIKIYEVNFYLPREKITIDPVTRYHKSGFEALFVLLEERHPRGCIVIG
jgi:hypothetical protein